ncbi:MAG: DUF6119 family protein, partial [Streptococcus mitis]|nr:DUF6119 family protein [Streptococcus mitis]
VVSAQLYKNEILFIKNINELFEEDYFKPDDEIEVIYGVIDKRFTKKASEILPFFSMVNLSQHYDNLSNMGIKCRLLFIEQKINIYNQREEKTLNRVKNELKDQEKNKDELYQALSDFLITFGIFTPTTFKESYLDKFVDNHNLNYDGEKYKNIKFELILGEMGQNRKLYYLCPDILNLPKYSIIMKLDFEINYPDKFMYDDKKEHF